LNFVHQQFRGQEMKAKNNSNLKLGQQQMDLIYKIPLEGVLNNIGKATKGSTQIEPRDWH